MLRGAVSAMGAGRLAKSAALSVSVKRGTVMTGLAGGGAGSVSPGGRYFVNNSRVSRKRSPIPPASLMGAS
jgi:nicotinamide mononucleotide (NMN) deamidase PncC